MGNENIVLFSGYAKMTDDTVISEGYKVMALVVLLDIRNGEIVEAECALPARLAERFVASMMIGRKLHTDYKVLVACINNTYQGSARTAILIAFRIIYAKYLAYNRMRKAYRKESRVRLRNTLSAG